jgi:hypothetical protein
MSKKTLWFGIALLIVVALAVLAVGCGGDDATTTTAATPTTSGPATTAAPGTGSTTATSAATDTTVGQPVKMYVGGTFALTGAYAEDCAAVLAGFQDYISWVNDNHMLAPWATDKVIPANYAFEVLWGDDALAPDKTLTIYDDLKSKGLLVQRVSGSPEGMALKDRLVEDKVGATSQSTSPAYINPPGNIFTNAPIYTDEMAAIAQWFLTTWKDTSRKPNIAFLTADSTLGRNIDIQELKDAIVAMGYNFVGEQYVPMVPTAPPTTQLAWLKENKVDLAVGVMINPGTQPTIKEAVRLGMGPDQAYKITFGFGNPAHLQIFVPSMGETGNGVVVAGDFCARDAAVPGIEFADKLLATYRKDGKQPNTMYLDGIIEAMTQVEALRLAAAAVGDATKLTSQDVLEKGFWQIKDMDTGGIYVSKFTYAQDKVQGIDAVNLQQVQAGKIVNVGSTPLFNIVAAKK